MTPMTVFIVAAALLVIAVVAILVLPLWRAPKASRGADQRQFNLAIFRDQLAELERDRNDGVLAEADFEQAKSELQRRLLEEVQPETVASPEGAGSRKTALALLVALPLLASAGYALLGNPRALDPMQTQAKVSPQQFEEMLGKLVDRLQKNPDDAKGWAMLARSYKVLGRLAEAADAYGRAVALNDQDAALFSDYAETLSQMNGGKLQGKPSELIARALKIDPEDPQSLFMAGVAASERSDFAGAADYWSRLLAKLDPASEDYTTLEDYIAKARQSAGLSPAKGDKTKPVATATSMSVSGQAVLSSKLASQARPGDVLFIFARAEQGPRMPLAAIKATVADLPLTFRLDDSMALPGGRKISEFSTVRVEARIAKAGTAQTTSGDLFGGASGVKLGSQGLKLTIDQVQP
jgi:cytochrome c-type biogenesis protein CcmH